MLSPTSYLFQPSPACCAGSVRATPAEPTVAVPMLCLPECIAQNQVDVKECRSASAPNFVVGMVMAAQFLGSRGTIYHFLPPITPIVRFIAAQVNDWKGKSV